MTGQQLKELRKQKGLEQQFVAKAAGLTKQQLSRIENGSRDVTVTEFVRIARAMGEEPGDLLPSTGGVTPDLRPIVDLVAAMSTGVRKRAAAILQQLVELDYERPPLPLGTARVTPARTVETGVLQEIAVHDRGHGK